MPRVLFAVVVACVAAAGVAAQQGITPPPVVFRSEVNYVEVDAIVTDARGAVVSDLTEADFEILEDGRPQKIATFAQVELPSERAERLVLAGRPVEPDVRTNRSVEGRVYLIVLDDLHTAFERTSRVKAAARRFIEEAIGLTDVAAVVYTGRNDASQDFTGNTRLLLEAVDRFSGRKLPPATLNQLNGATEQVVTQPNRTSTTQLVAGPDIDKEERAFRARSAMASIRRLSEFLASVRGRRKAMLLFGEGIDYDVNQAMGAEGSTASIVLEDVRNAIAAAQRGNVAIYSIDPRGLFDSADTLIDTPFVLHDDNPGRSAMAAAQAQVVSSGAGSSDESTILATATRSTRPVQTQADQASIQSEVRLAQDSLRALAIDTGGFAMLNTNDFAGAVGRIIQENSSYYLLGYYPPSDKRDGRTHRLQVRVKRPDVNVRARNGYLAPRSKREPTVPAGAEGAFRPVADALASPLPMADVPMTVFAAAFKGTTPNASIVYSLEIDASTLDFTERDGAWSTQIDVMDTAAGPDGRMMPGERQRLDLALNPANYSRVKAGGLRVVGQMDLPPGRYQLRFAAGDRTRAGNVLYDLEVPDFSRDKVAISSVALTSRRSANAMGTVRPKDPLGDFLPGPPVATRQFRRDDTLTLFAEVYDNPRSSEPHQVLIATQLRNSAGLVVAQTVETRPASDLLGKSGGYGVTANVSLAGVAPGPYFLHVEAQVQSEGLPGAARDIQLRVIQ